MSRTLEVFEHGRLPIGDGAQELRQPEFDALVRFNDDHGGRYFGVGHRHLKAQSYVGYIEVGQVAIEILPKADRDLAGASPVWREGLLEMLRVALGLRLQPLRDAAQRLTRNRLLDLIAQAYLAELAPLLREGLAKGYRTTQSNGAVFRGRLKIAEHLRDNLARADRFFVEYQTFDHDIAVNRVLAAALDALSWRALSPSVASKVDACLAQLPELQATAVTAADVNRIRLTRATQRYAKALIYARMILDQLGPHLRAGRARVFSLLFDMNVLWERYVATLLRRAAPPGLRVHAQESSPFWRADGHRVRSVKPDLVVRAAGSDVPGPALLVIDTKWKVPQNGLPSDDDLQQMFVYNELLRAPRAVLLYPQTATSQSSGGAYVTKLHTCEQRHLGLCEAGRWSSAAIQRQLADLLAGVSRSSPVAAGALGPRPPVP
jgi:5-methylcytosine-specific restriction enzyme subunit McrC